LIGFALLSAEIIDDVGFIGQPDGAAINRTKSKAFAGLIVVFGLINGVNQLMVDIDKCGRRQLFSRREKGRLCDLLSRLFVVVCSCEKLVQFNLV